MQKNNILSIAIIALFISLFSVGCKKEDTTDPNTTNNTTNTNNNKNVFYFIKDGVKYDLSNKSYVDNNPLAVIGRIDSAWLQIHPFNLPNIDNSTNFPVTGSIGGGWMSLFVLNGKFYEQTGGIGDSLNYFRIDTAVVANNLVVYMKGNFGAHYVNTRTTNDHFYIEGIFDIDNR